MEKLTEFVVNNYVLFLTITIILIFALIGYIYDSKKEKEDKVKKNEDEINEQMLENLVVPEGKSLADTVMASKNNEQVPDNTVSQDATIQNNEQLK